MKKTVPFIVPVLGFCVFWFVSSALSAQLATESLNKSPLAFTKNMGQWDERVLFRTIAGDATMWITKEGVTYQFFKRIEKDSTSMRADMPPYPGKFSPERDSIEEVLITAKFVGANSNPEAIGKGSLEYKCNYFIGNEPTKWHTDVPNYEAITLKDIYPGIDLKYSGDGHGQAAYEYIVAPGADLAQIKISYEGAEATTIDADGRLILQTKSGNMIAALKSAAGGSLSGAASLKQLSAKTIGFEASGSSRQALGPLSAGLVYSTYIGGGDDDYGSDIAIDSSGNAYVTGYTWSVNFPTQNPFQATFQGAQDVFVTKLSSSGNNLVYSTYLGGSDSDEGRGIAIDGSGNVYVTGYTYSSNFPIQNPYQPTLQGSTDAFVTKLSSSGNSLIYSTYLGGVSGDYANGIAIDSHGLAYVTGGTNSSNFPTLNPYQATFQGGDCSFYSGDAFVTKFSSSGNSLIYSTYLGGGSADLGTGITVDVGDNAFITGMTSSSNFPTQNPYQATYQGGVCSSTNTYGGDAFVTKLSNAGNSLIYSTYLGGGNNDGGYGIAVNRNGNACVTGFTTSTNFPILNPYQTDGTVFVTKLSVTGNDLIYSTYFHGTDSVFAVSGNDIAVDDSGGAYVTGAVDVSPSKFYDVFVIKFSNAGNGLIYSIYLGGKSYDFGLGLAVDGSENAYVTGFTESSDFPIQNPYQSTHQGKEDVFVTKISPQALAVVQGHVYQANIFHTPLSGATIEVKRAGILVGSTVSGELGAYSLTVPSGVSDVTISASDYETITETGLQIPAEGLSRDFELLLSEYSNLDVSVTLDPNMIADMARLGTDTVIFRVQVVNQSRVLNNVEFKFELDGNPLPWHPGALDGNGDGLIDEVKVGLKQLADTIVIPALWNNKELTARIASIESWKLERMASLELSVAYLDNFSPYRMNVDGYRFPNPSGDIFSSSLFYHWIAGTDWTLLKATELLPGITLTWFGACFGMAASSNSYFIDPTQKPVPIPTFQMNLGMQDVADKIMEYHLSSLKPIYQSFTGQDAISLGDEVKSGLEGKHSLVLALRDGIKDGGHAVTVFKSISDVTNNRQYISIYDNEQPYPASPSVLVINRANNTYEFPYFSTWQSLRVFENIISKSKAELIADLWTQVKSVPGKLFAKAKTKLGVRCPVHPLVVDDQGHRLGYVDDTTWLSEISGAEYWVLPTDKNDSSYSFDLPIAHNYSVSARGIGTGYLELLSFSPVDQNSGVLACVDSVPITQTTSLKFNLLASTNSIDSLLVDEDGDSVIDHIYRPERNLPPGSVNLISPVNGIRVGADSVCFIWSSSVNIVFADTIKYSLVISNDQDFSDSVLYTGLSDTSATIAGFLSGRTYYWRVYAIDKSNLRTPSTFYGSFLYAPYLCGDANNSRTVNISDVVFLISYIFAGGPAPNPLLEGDADCNSFVNISDAVYLISYIFAGGQVPCAKCN